MLVIDLSGAKDFGCSMVQYVQDWPKNTFQDWYGYLLSGLSAMIHRMQVAVRVESEK
jgi:hypothetical protein